jgi:ADP-ribose pyrophosphatase
MNNKNMSETARTWKVVLSEKMADCRVFEVRRDVCVDETAEREATFYCLEAPDWCNIIGLTANNEILLIEQFRHGIRQPTLEIPGGIVDEGETPEQAAVRELLEETGYAAGKVVYLGKSHPNPAIQNNFLHHFAAFNCEKKQEPMFDGNEHCLVRLAAFEEINRLIAAEEITHSLVLAGFQKFAIHRGQSAKP